MTTSPITGMEELTGATSTSPGMITEGPNNQDSKAFMIFFPP